MGKIKKGIGSTLLGLAIISGFVVHIVNVVAVLSIGNLLEIILTIFLPGIAEVYWCVVFLSNNAHIWVVIVNAMYLGGWIVAGVVCGIVEHFRQKNETTV